MGPGMECRGDDHGKPLDRLLFILVARVIPRVSFVFFNNNWKPSPCGNRKTHPELIWAFVVAGDFALPARIEDFMNGHLVTGITTNN